MKAREPEKQSLGVKRREEIGRLQAPRLGKSLQVGKIPTKINFSTGRFLRCPRKNSRLSSAAYWHVACYNLQDENKLGARPHGSRIRQKDWRHRWEAHTLIFVERAIHSQSEPPNGDMSGIAWHSVASVANLRAIGQMSAFWRVIAVSGRLSQKDERQIGPVAAMRPPVKRGVVNLRRNQ
jgi:hypothetical protein